MRWAIIRGITSTEEAEIGYLSVYNGQGSELSQGSPVCWDGVASDGRTVKTPATSGFTNFNLLAGIAIDTLATAAYNHNVVAYGPCMARTYGIATTLIPGAMLWLVDAKDYLAYGTEGIPCFGGSGQPNAFTALDTHTTVSAERTKVFVRAL